MIYAVVFAVLYFAGFGVLSWVMTAPWLIVISLICFPSLIQTLPWALMVPDSQDTDASSPIGFIRDGDLDEEEEQSHNKPRKRSLY